jgi:tubulin polyglutamylase TTLL6/13
LEKETLAKLIANQRVSNGHVSGRDPFIPQLVLNAQYTQYEVMKDVSEALNFQLSFNEQEDPDWDLYWLDGPITPAFLFRMQSHQRVNHFAGMHVLARKNLLARNL